MNLTQLSKLQGAAKGKAFAVKKELLEKIENKTKAETEKLLAKSFPERPKKAMRAISYTPDGGANLTLRLTAEQFTKLQELQALRSHRIESIEDLFERFIDAEIDNRTKIKNLPKSSEKLGRVALNRNLRKVLFEQNHYECQYTSAGGQKCRSKHFLEIEHIQPLARGGSNELQNLTVLCRAHNQYQARKLGLMT